MNLEIKMNKEEILKDQNNSNYIKQYSAYNHYQDKGINNDLIRFYYQFNHLKNIFRPEIYRQVKKGGEGC